MREIWLNEARLRNVHDSKWCQLWAKSGLLPIIFSVHITHFFRSLGSKKFNASNGSQFGVKTREIWPIETMLHKEHVVMGVQFFLVVQAEF